METWKTHPTYTNIEVSNASRVRYVSTCKILRGWVNGMGYHLIEIRHHNKRKALTVHKLLGECWIDNHEDKPCIDHIDGNRTNNAISNLRWCTHVENQRNRQVTGRGSSAYKGVTWHKASGKWTAQISVDGHNRHLGYFTDEREAARAYNAAAQDLFGEYACINVITDLD